MAWSGRIITLNSTILPDAGADPPTGGFVD
jgi:hypothetical protein